MNPRTCKRTAAATLLLTATLIGGCAAMVLANREKYATDAHRLNLELDSAIAAATAAAEAENQQGYDESRERIAEACRVAEHQASQGEAAVRSYYAQRSTETVEEIARRQACTADGQSRYAQGTQEVRGAAMALRDECGCYTTMRNDAEGAERHYVQLEKCNVLNERRDNCLRLHRIYTQKFQDFQEIRELCAERSESQSEPGALTAEALDIRIQKALEDARQLRSNDDDGSEVYKIAWNSVQKCAAFFADEPMQPAERLAEVDTGVDQEPGSTGDYEVPEPDYTPPPETPPPPGGG